MKTASALLFAASLLAFTSAAHAKGGAKPKLDCSEALTNPASDNYDENMRARCLGPEGKVAAAVQKQSNIAKAEKWKKEHPEAYKKEKAKQDKRMQKAHEERQHRAAGHAAGEQSKRQGRSRGQQHAREQAAE